MGFSQNRILLFTLLSLLLAGCRQEPDTVFTRLDPGNTGITFVNQTGESDSFNILTNEYIYNGGGVGMGDFDGDGRTDIFFSGSAAENELYLNRGDWKFDNVSEIAGIGGGARWNNGVTIVDVNDDGLDDIYVCATLNKDPANRANQLFLNQGNNADGIPTFVDAAPEYGIANTGHNTQAAWLDYDGDGDLDLFLLVNEMVDNKRPNDFSRKVQDGSGTRTDKLFRQDRKDGKISFTEVGQETGILFQGFALAVTVCDFNRDGWPDLYVSNDYLSNDLAYLNTAGADGGRYFVDIADKITKHTSYSAMGNDVADLNNDGLPDILAVDMLPADNIRRKMMLTANNYTYLLNLERYGYHPQFTRNSLQLSQGLRPDSLSTLPNYSEVAMQAGLPATDWSWTPLVADFDLDGNKDVIITNGFPRDITDKDFGDYNVANSRFFSVAKLLEKIPSVKIPNVAYRADSTRDGVPVFTDVSKDWGIDVTSFSNGAAFADLDNDGDLDYVVNNIYDPAHVYRNNTVRPGAAAGSLRISAAEGIHDAAYWGSEVTVAGEDGSRQTFYWHPHRGYLSSHATELVVGVNGPSNVEVKWKNGPHKTYGPFQPGQEVSLNPAEGADAPGEMATGAPLVAALPSPAFTHEEEDFIDFNVQPMLLHKLSQQGPGLAVTDWNGDGIDDIYVSGSYGHPGTFLRGTGTGFTQVPSLLDDATENAREELGALFFDADGDGDDDLYLVSGSNEMSLTDGNYADRLYEFSGGRYTLVPGALDGMAVNSGSCVRAADYDGDGDLDLFVASRVAPHAYPKPVGSLLLRNESTPGNIRFTTDAAATAAIAGATNVCDALFTDYDNDGDRDLLLAGEWSPIRLYQNTGGQFSEVTEAMGLAGASGWWNSLAAGDFDNDGDIDYLAGNLGTNSILRPNAQEPVTAMLTDFDKNGGLDFIPFTYFDDGTGQRRAFPYFNRNDFVKQITKIKGIHKTHGSYALAGAETYQQERDDVFQFRVDYSSSVLLENTGNGFTFKELPQAAQSFPVFGMLPVDLNGDDLLDVLVIGNDYGSETGQGYMDAGNGLALINVGDGHFRSVQADKSSFSVPGEGRALVVARGADGPLIVAAQNSGPLVLARTQVPLKVVTAGEGGTVALSGGGSRRVESYFGSGYLGQSARGSWVRE